MQINLNPNEINDVIKASLIQKGIDLQDKNVSFKFNNRRTKGGIFAVVSIENAAVVVPLEAVAAVLVQATPEPITAPTTVDVFPTDPTPEPVVDTQPEPAPDTLASTVTSLFG